MCAFVLLAIFYISNSFERSARRRIFELNFLKAAGICMLYLRKRSSKSTKSKRFQRRVCVCGVRVKISCDLHQGAKIYKRTFSRVRVCGVFAQAFFKINEKKTFSTACVLVWGARNISYVSFTQAPKYTKRHFQGCVCVWNLCESVLPNQRKANVFNGVCACVGCA